VFFTGESVYPPFLEVGFHALRKKGANTLSGTNSFVLNQSLSAVAFGSASSVEKTIPLALIFK
jgi:hypothetical protein